MNSWTIRAALQNFQRQLRNRFHHDFFKNKFIYFIYFYFWLCWVFLAARAFSSCGERGLLLVAARGFLIAVASLVAEHGL